MVDELSDFSAWEIVLFYSLQITEIFNIYTYNIPLYLYAYSCVNVASVSLYGYI